LLELLSMTGLGICLIVHVAAFSGAEFDAELRKNVLVGMQLFAMAVYGFSMTLDRSFREGLATQRYRKEIGALTPLGFKVAQRLLTAYALALLGVVFYRILVMHQNSEIDPIPLFSAFQAMFLLEAFRMTQVRGWRATGHTVF
jgi:hypothetical protein